jgi:hypothetical protein
MRRGQVGLDHRVVVALADLPVGVADLAHHDVLADFGVVHQRVASVPPALTADTLAALTAGEPGTGGAAGFGNVGTVSPGTSGKYGFLPQTLLPGMTVYADAAAGSTGPQLLYQAIGSSNLRAYADQDAVGHAAISNLVLFERQLLIGD